MSDPSALHQKAKMNLNSMSETEEEKSTRARLAIQAYKNARTRIIVETTLASFLGAVLGGSGSYLLVSSLFTTTTSSIKTIGLGSIRATPSAFFSITGMLFGSSAAAILFSKECSLDEALDSKYLTTVGLSEEQCDKLRGLR